LAELNVCGFDTDSIEANVETASVSVEEGIEQLRQARQSQVDLLTEIIFCFYMLQNHWLIHVIGKALLLIPVHILAVLEP